MQRFLDEIFEFTEVLWRLTVEDHDSGLVLTESSLSGFFCLGYTW